MSCKTEQKSSVFSLLWKTGSDGNAHTDSSRLNQINAAANEKAWSPMVAHEVCEATSADTLEECNRRHVLRSETYCSSDATNCVRWANYTSSSCKFPIVYMRRKLWKLVGSKQSNCNNKGCHFLDHGIYYEFNHPHSSMMPSLQRTSA